MAIKRKRYWVYVHNKDGDLEYDLGEYGDLSLAIDEAVSYLHHGEINPELTARVVDNELQDGTTVWSAGPVEHKEGYVKGTDGRWYPTNTWMGN